MTDWTIITRSLKARLFSTVTTVITVGVAVALMLVLLTMRDSGRRAFERGSGNMHLLISRDASPLVSILNGVFYAGAPRSPIYWREYEKFAKETPLLDWAVPIQLGDSYHARWPVLATTPEFFTKYKPGQTEDWEFAQGRAFDKDFEVVVGATAARTTAIKVGDKLTLTHGFPSRDSSGPAPHEHKEYQYTVVGILKPTGLAHDRSFFTNLESTWIIHAHDRKEEEERKARGGAEETPQETATEEPTTAADITDDDRKITDIYVHVITREGSTASPSLQMVFDKLRKGQGVLGSSITVAAPSEEVRKLLIIVSNVDQIFLAIAAAVMLSSGIAIMLALYNSMEQRRRQIAVLRVLGASRGRVFGLVVTESAVIGLLGAIAGVAVAALGAWLASTIMKERLGLLIDPSLQPIAVIGVSVSTIVLAAAAGLAPAIVAYRNSVARNLRPLG
jgi:putative ABC transport system permease protein